MDDDAHHERLRVGRGEQLVELVDDHLREPRALAFRPMIVELSLSSSA